MSYTYKISSSNNFCYVEASGIVKGEEAIKTTAKMMGDPKWNAGINQINDYRAITKLLISIEDLQELYKIEEEMERQSGGKQGKLAFVVVDSLYETICSLYAVNSKERKHEIKIFRIMQDAVEWLGLEKSPEEILYDK